jgi:hypothetical protein
MACMAQVHVAAARNSGQAITLLVQAGANIISPLQDEAAARPYRLRMPAGLREAQVGFRFLCHIIVGSVP